jgi:hypothetical protein
MKKIFTLAIIVSFVSNAYAYHFSATAPTGQTLYYTIVGNNVVEIVAPYSDPIYYGLSGDLTIPSTVTNAGTTYTVVSINGAFRAQSGLTSVIIPNTVTNIGANSFSSTGLVSVVMGDGITTIDEGAFNYCNSLTSIVWSSSLTTIGKMAFYHCQGLTSLELPNSVTFIGPYAFQSCTNLTSVSCGNSLVTIREWAFQGCSMSTISFPNTLTTIGERAFKNCGNLSSIEIPNSVTTIGQEAFSRSGLHKVTLGSSVSSIGADAFRYCGNLDSVFSKAFIPPTMQYYTFGAPDAGIVLMVPCGATTAYQSNDQWGVFSNMQEWVPYTVEVSSNDTTKGNVIISTYPSCSNNHVCTIEATANSGYHFAHWSDGNPQNPRTLNVDHDILLVAIFYEYIITANSNNESQGIVGGGGYYCNGDVVNLTATPLAGYQFAHWHDGNTDNPRTIIVSSDSTFIAFFEQDEDCQPINTFPWNNIFDETLSCWGNIDADNDGYSWTNYQGYALSESWSYFDGSNHALSPDNWIISREIQIPSSGNYTLSWTAKSMMAENNYYSEHYTVYVSNTGGNPSDFSNQLYSETLNSINAVNRNKSLNNYRGQTIRIAFRHHNCSEQFILAIGNIKITQEVQSIDDIDNAGIFIYSEDKQIHIDEAIGEEIRVYTIDGRAIASLPKATEHVAIPVTNTGVYIVKIGDHPARKVVVIR